MFFESDIDITEILATPPAASVCQEMDPKYNVNYRQALAAVAFLNSFMPGVISVESWGVKMRGQSVYYLAVKPTIEVEGVNPNETVPEVLFGNQKVHYVARVDFRGTTIDKGQDLGLILDRLWNQRSENAIQSIIGLAREIAGQRLSDGGANLTEAEAYQSLAGVSEAVSLICRNFQNDLVAVKRA